MEPIEEQNNECNNWIEKVELSLRVILDYK